MAMLLAKPGKWLDELPSDATVLDLARAAIKERVKLAAGRLPLAAASAEADPEHVHQLRVMARRSQAALATFQEVLPKRRRKKLNSRLRDARKCADAARDFDVLLMRLAERADTPQEFLAEVKSRREAAQPALVEMCVRLEGGNKLWRLRRRLLQHSPPKSKKAKRVAAMPFAEWAPVHAREEVSLLLAAMPEVPDAAAWHRFRIGAKRARYTLEALADALPDAVRERAYPMLVDVQDTLGAMNDHATAARRMGDWADAGGGVFAAKLAQEELTALEEAKASWRRRLDDDGLEQLRETLLGSLG